MSKLNIKKNNPIDGGDVNLVYDPASEELHYHGYVRFKIGPIKKKINFNEAEKVARDLLRSSSLFEGKTIEIKDLKITVIGIHAEFATVSFDSDNFDGVIELDISKEYFDILSIKATGKFQGMKLKMEAFAEG